MVIETKDLSAQSGLTVGMQVRFTSSQVAILREIAKGSRRPLSAVVRDMAMGFAANHLNDEAWLVDEPAVIDVEALVADLNRLAEFDAEENDGP